MSQDVLRTPETPPEEKLTGFLGLVERVGNKIPSPHALFAILFVVIAVVASVVAWVGARVRVPGAEEELTVKAPLSADGLVTLLTGAVDNFITFPALPTVLVIALGIGIAQGSGALEAAIRLLFSRVPRAVAPYAVALIATSGHVMADTAYVVIPPLAALAFLAVGRHPLAGLIGAYACVGTGYAGGLLLGGLDANLAGITQEAASALPGWEDYAANLSMNYYFGIVAALGLTVVGGLMIDTFLEPRLGEWRPEDRAEESGSAGGALAVAGQTRAVLVAVGVTLAYAALVVTLWLLPGSALRGEDGALIPSPFMSGLIVLIALGFAIFGITYSFALPKGEGRRDIGAMMEESIRSVASFTVLIFLIAQALAMLSYSNLGIWVAVELAGAAESIGLEGLPLLLGLALISTVMNLLITSGSGLWALEAPVVVPTLMMLDLSPATIQAAHRIGDSLTQAVSPMNVFLFVVLLEARKWVPGFTLGQLLRHVVPFVPVFAVIWVSVLCGFVLLELPPGPGETTYLP